MANVPMELIVPLLYRQLNSGDQTPTAAEFRRLEIDLERTLARHVDQQMRRRRLPKSARWYLIGLAALGPDVGDDERANRAAEFFERAFGTGHVAFRGEILEPTDADESENSGSR